MHHHVLTRAAAIGAFFVLTTTIARAQQFQQVTLFPDGPSGNYSEGVECVDIDHDGDLDVIVADGDGASSGTSRQNRVYVNKLVETGVQWSLVDESVARFGANLSNAKGVTTGDVNGDGWVDVLFVNSNNQPPSLYINQGAANPGFFTLESSTRGLTTGFFAGSAMFADLDDDGDLDLIINDAFNSGTTKHAHLYINDGTGHFTQNDAALNAPLRTLQQDIQLVDINNDWTIDCVGITKSTQYLLLNDGTAHFTDMSSLLTPASGNSYEAEVGDLDGDGDIDLFFVSLVGFQEGVVRNNLVPSGTFTLTNLSPLPGSVDDNEIALIDYDNDGDYDVLVGSLGAHETMWRNDGNMNFTDVSATVIQSQSDSTLDCTFADLNNDGAYDLITVQGESGSFRDKFYHNTGSPDTLPPVLVAEQYPPSATVGSPVVAHAKIRDQVLDDGVNYVTMTGEYVILTAPEAALVTINGGGFSPATLNVGTGTTVTWSNGSGVAQTVTSTTTPYTYNSGTIAAGGTYARTFVAPGTYNYTSTPSGFTATVVVSGSTTPTISLYQGGQQYRARMNDTSGGLGVQLCYELRFRDWPGNVMVTPSHCIPLTGALTGAGFCFGDGTGTACPCGNNAAPGAGTGCVSSLGAGARLAASGTASLAGDTLVLAGTGMPNSSALYFQGSTQIGGGLGAQFNDGLRCAGGTVFRLGTKTNVGGASQYPGGGDPGISVRGMVTATGTREYQVWYRNAASFCTSATANLTEGWEIQWQP